MNILENYLSSTICYCSFALLFSERVKMKYGMKYASKEKTIFMKFLWVSTMEQNASGAQFFFRNLVLVELQMSLNVPICMRFFVYFYKRWKIVLSFEFEHTVYAYSKFQVLQHLQEVEGGRIKKKVGNINGLTGSILLTINCAP